VIAAACRGALLALGLACATSAWPQSKVADGGALANKAMRQAMLVERIARLYAQVGLNVLAPRSRRTLPAAMREFSAGLAELSAAASTPELRENYLMVRRLWESYAPIVSQSPSLDGAKKVAERTEEIAWIAAKGARLFQSQAGLARTELAMAAGEMRWRSQQIAKLHLLRHWGVRTEGIVAELTAADAAYAAAVGRLKDAEALLPELAEDLRAAENQYLFLGQAAGRLATRTNVARELEYIAKTGDNLLEATDRVARLCEPLRK
jgi:hypothetical protein